MSRIQAAITIACILLVIDFFLLTDVITLAAYVLLAVVFASYFPFGFLNQVLIGCVIGAGLVVGHYALWRRYIQAFSNRVLAPTRFRAGAEGRVGDHGVIRAVEGKLMLDLGGDLWEYESPRPLEDGASVVVRSARGATLSVEPLVHPE